MNGHFFISVIAAVLVVLGAGCAKKEAPPVVPAQPEVAAPVAEENPPTSGEESATAGEVRIDLRKDETSARPKASAGAEEPVSSQNQQSSQSQPMNQNTGAAKSFTITATQWSFSPDTITVNEDDLVRLRVTSLDVPHGILIDGYDINKVLNPNETATFEFVADKKGTFPFRCSVQCGGGHPTMTGKLIVE